jgi:hypothetical protein
VKASASIVSTTTTWQRRVASAFADQWQDDGKVANIEELGTPDGEIGQAEILQWYARLRTERPGLLFSAMGAEQTRVLAGWPMPTRPNPIPCCLGYACMAPRR